MNPPATALSAPDSETSTTHCVVADITVALTVEGALHLEEEATLVVADLHLEKGSAFAARGQMLPPYDTSATLRRLAAVIARLAPRRVVALGDSFHDRRAAERLGEAEVQAFETEGLIGAGAAPAVLSYLFHRIEDRFDGRPTLLIVDEGWLALDDPGFAGQLREWLKTLRKKNASVIFATQSLADIDGSAIAPAIIESCPTRILLPNERALEPQIAAIYQRFGLNDRQIEILSRATPKREYYCQSRRGNRLFELGLSEVALAFTAASAKSDQTAIEELLAEHGRGGFTAAWLRRKDLDWAADMLTHNQETTS